VDAGDGLPPDCGTPGAYTIPADNPFVGDTGACDEIWALGLRNPWRISFDRLTHDLYIGDVGQGVIEEIDFQPAASDGGENYGWSCFEGTRSNPQTGADECEPASAYEGPLFEYNHDFGCAVTGGYVYRGTLSPDLFGRYIFTDYCTGYFWDLDVENGWQATRHDNLQRFGFTTFGEGANGEIYVANTGSGEILRVTAGDPFVLQNPVHLPIIAAPLAPEPRLE
jgi:glucose/arabinose dehydrogenase